MLNCYLVEMCNVGIPVSSTNKTDHHDITEILLKKALNTITLPFIVRNMSFMRDIEYTSPEWDSNSQC
jgi:hypothetical protein